VPGTRTYTVYSNISFKVFSKGAGFGLYFVESLAVSMVQSQMLGLCSGLNIGVLCVSALPLQLNICNTLVYLVICPAALIICANVLLTGDYSFSLDFIDFSRKGSNTTRV